MNKPFLLLLFLSFVSFRTVLGQEKENTSSADTTGVYEVAPQFPGGMDEYLKFIKETLRYPAEARKLDVEGTVLIQFIVGKDGKIIDSTIYVIQSVHPAIDNEALQLVKSMPKWTPGYSNGEPVNVQMVMPLTFELASSQKKSRKKKG